MQSSLITKEEILKDCTVHGNIVKLPEVQLDRKMYLDVAKSLNLIGGKWKGGKVQGFVFPNDPTELLAQISNGEKRNLKKEYQFFATPSELADKLVELAEIEEAHRILEPSAGRGAIVDAIVRELPSQTVECFELMDINRTFLRDNPSAILLGNDFLEIDESQIFDRIIANPPFSKNQDIDHIRKMHSVLKKGGKLVSICSRHWLISNNKKETEFRNWLERLNAEIIDVPQDAFKESGTKIATAIIVIDK